MYDPKTKPRPNSKLVVQRRSILTHAHTHVCTHAQTLTYDPQPKPKSEHNSKPGVQRRRHSIVQKNESEVSARLRSLFFPCLFFPPFLDRERGLCEAQVPFFFLASFVSFFFEQEQGLREAQGSFTVYTYIHPITHTHTHTYIYLREARGSFFVVVGLFYLILLGLFSVVSRSLLLSSRSF
jgi:hypothetical protein